MPDEFGGYGEEQPAEGPSAGERAQEIGGAFASVVQKIGVGKIIAVLVIVAAIYIFLQLPRPVTVRVLVSQLDADSPVQVAEVSASYSDFFGSHTPGVVDVGDGMFKVVVPSKTSVEFSVLASGFKPARASKAFEADGNLPIALAWDSKASFVSSPIAGSIGPTCSVSYSVEIANNGDSAESVALVQDGLEGAFSYSQGIVEIGPDAKATLSFGVSSAGKAEGDAISGKVRIKGTSKDLPVDVIVGKQPQLSVPPAIDFSGTETKLFVELRNTGESDISNIIVAPSEAIAGKVRISEFKSGVVLKKDDKLPFVIEATGMSKDDKGLLDVGADCISLQRIPVSYRE